MKIIIDYEASWRNSFLDGSNNERPHKKGRKFIGSIKQLNENKGNYKSQIITLDTILGVLNRLIGDQRKLYQSKQEFGNYKHYFEDIVHAIHFEDKPKVLSNEIVYIRNLSGSTDQNSYTGMIKVTNPAFQSDFSPQFWGVIFLDLEQLCNFILEDKKVDDDNNYDPICVLNRLREIKKIKPVKKIDNLQLSCDKLSSIFHKYKPFDSKGMINILSIYCSALYLQLQRLEKKHDISSIKSKMGGISGISNNGFTAKDFMDKYTTGPKKLIYGNPYIREELIKGEGKVKYFLIKASGQLDIHINIEIDRAIEIKNLIDCAGVSSFYLGKKGLAYISQIDVR